MLVIYCDIMCIVHWSWWIGAEALKNMRYISALNGEAAWIFWYILIFSEQTLIFWVKLPSAAWVEPASFFSCCDLPGGGCMEETALKTMHWRLNGALSLKAVRWSLSSALDLSRTLTTVQTYMLRWLIMGAAWRLGWRLWYLQENV